jgi:hypothetical protein
MKLVFRKHRDIFIENLDTERVAAKFVPCLLKEEKKQTSFKSAEKFLTVQTMMKNFEKHITAMMSEQKPRLYNWSQKRHTDPKEHANSVKCESVVYSFLGVNVAFTMNFLPRNQTINKEMKFLREAARK